MVLQQRANMVFADSDTSQCNDMMNDNAPAPSAMEQDENMVGATIDGISLHQNDVIDTSSSCAMNVNHLKGLEQVEKSTDCTAATIAAAKPSSLGLDFLADAATKARNDFPSSRRVSNDHRQGLRVAHTNADKTQDGHFGVTPKNASKPQDGIVADLEEPTNKDHSRNTRRVSNENSRGLYVGRNDADKSIVAEETIPEKSSKKNQDGIVYFDDSNQGHGTSSSSTRRVSNDDGHRMDDQTIAEGQGEKNVASDNSWREDLYDFSDDSDKEQEGRAALDAVNKVVATANTDNFVDMTVSGDDTAKAKFQQESIDLNAQDVVNKGQEERPGVDEDYDAESDTGKSGADVARQESSDEDLDDSSDEDDGFWENRDQDRKIRSKSVIHDDCLDSSPEKNPYSHSSFQVQFEDDSDVDMKDDDFPVDKGSPRPFSPFEDTDDGSDFSLTAPPSSKKKKKKRKKTQAKKSGTTSAITESDRRGSPSSDVSGPTRKRKKQEADQPSKKRERQRLTARKSTGSSLKKANSVTATLKVGDRVYAEWAKGDWYWGQVTAVTRKKHSHYEHYSVRTM